MHNDQRQQKKIAIVQSNYIPWKGYFDLVNMVDEFILYDDMQYTRRDWRNRNKIKTSGGTLWLTIPVEVKGKYFQKIRETKASETGWREKHWRTICHNYSQTPFFREYASLFEELYIGRDEAFLSIINYTFITAINKLLGVTTKISWSDDYHLVEEKTERLVDLCRQARATHYVSGPSAKGYLVEELFKKENIGVTWMDYTGYPEYHQLYPPFNHEVSIVDLIFNEGPNAPHFMKSFSPVQEAAS